MKMLLEQKVMVRWSGNNKKHYIECGYVFTKVGDDFEVDIKDLCKYSRTEVNIQCDYCGKLFQRKYENYNRGIKIINKASCKECFGLKNKEIMLLKYNVDSYSKTNECKDRLKITNLDRYGTEYYVQSENFKEKSRNTCLEKYGEEHYTQTDESKEKYRNTCIEKYGVENPCFLQEVKDKKRNTCIKKYGVNHPSQNKEINEKMNINRCKALYENNTAPSSIQQKYLYDLIGGLLNYPVWKCNLDIAFKDELIYIEYDGGGHLLNVNNNNMTIEEFKEKEIKRYYFLRNQGWKMIRIISQHDLLPLDDKILEMISDAKEYLNTGHSWIYFNIDTQKIINSLGEFDYDFGELRKIKPNKKEVC